MCYRQIHLPDLMRFLKEDEAHRTINLFEGVTDENGISKWALNNWVVSNTSIILFASNLQLVAMNKLVE